MDRNLLALVARRAALAAALAGCLLGPLPANGRPDHVRTRDRVAFAKGSGASDAVRRECGIQTQLPRDLAEASHDVELVATYPERGRYLRLLITHVRAPGGGPFSGPKSIEVSARLVDDGRTIATAHAKRVSGGPFGGTCAHLRRITHAIAGDLAVWLRDPTRSGRLGDY